MKKHRLKNSLKFGILFFGILAVMTNCQEDDGMKPPIASLPNPGPSVKEINFNEFLNHKNSRPAIEKLNILNEKALKHSAIGHLDKNVQLLSFTVDSTSIKEIIKDGTLSFTFRIVQDSIDPTYFENLIIQTDSLLVTSAYLIKYIPEGDYDISVPFEGIREITELDPETSIDPSSNKEPACIEVITVYDYYLCDPGVVQSPENCDYTHSEEISQTTCNTTGGGTGYEAGSIYVISDTSSGNNNTGGTSGNGGTPVITTPNPPCTTCPTLVDRCQKLNDLLQDDVANDGSVPNIKPTLENLKTTLSQPGENGAQFKKSSGTYSNVDLPATAGNAISITAGGDNYGAVHTHPFSTFPMFSWSDIYTLFSLHLGAAPDVKDDVTFMLIVYPTLASAQPEVYSITVNNFKSFKDKINANLNAIVAEDDELTLASPLQDKINALNDKLGEAYGKDTNYEKVFLEQFGDHNISLYKANDDITEWSRLELNESLGTVFETPCN